MKNTLIIDNGLSYSDHSTYFVKCADEEEACALARLITAFGRAHVDAIGDIAWYEGGPCKKDPKEWWVLSAFGSLSEEDFNEAILSRISITDAERFAYLSPSIQAAINVLREVE